MLEYEFCQSKTVRCARVKDTGLQEDVLQGWICQGEVLQGRVFQGGVVQSVCRHAFLESRSWRRNSRRRRRKRVTQISRPPNWLSTNPPSWLCSQYVLAPPFLYRTAVNFLMIFTQFGILIIAILSRDSACSPPSEQRSKSILAPTFFISYGSTFAHDFYVAWHHCRPRGSRMQSMSRGSSM